MKPCGVNIVPISGALEVGTRIHWDQETQSAVFVDVPSSIVYKYDLASGIVSKAKVGNEPLAFMFPVKGSNSKYIAGLNRKIVFVEWDGVSPSVSSVETIAEVDTEPSLAGNRLNGGKVDPHGRLWAEVDTEPSLAGNRLNGGNVDPHGRLWAGTMGATRPDGLCEPGKGALYSISKGVVIKHICDIGISNGLAWDLKEKKMYYIDTLVPGVLQFDYDPNAVKISNKRIIFDFQANNVKGKPDGLTIDDDGKLWVCAIFGSELINVDPKNGSILKRIKFPTPEITAVTFGGKHLNDLFVTTAKIPIDGTVPPDPAGKTFVVKNICGSKGLPDVRYEP